MKGLTKWGDRIAYTKIIALRTRLDRAVNYVLNEEKTSLKSAISYAINPDKNEHHIYEGYIKCTKRTAFNQMRRTKERFNKLDGVQGYHIIQSFSPGEVTPIQAYQIAETFIHRYLAKRYETVWSTHLDQHHYHNHIVFNSVSYMDGKKYHSNYRSYMNEIRKISDEICIENNLSIIQETDESKSLTYAEWLAEHKGRASWNTIIKNDIDAAIAKAPSYGAFLVLMEHQGYEIKQGEYLAFRPMGKERFSRGYKLGKAYSKDAIKARIEGNEFLEELPVSYTPKRRRYVKVPMPDVLRIYWRYMYLLGKVKKHQAPPRISAYLKQELLKFESYKAQFKFIHQHGLYSETDISSFISSHQNEITKLYESLSELKKQYQSKATAFSALSDKAKYQQAHRLFQSGYTMMQDESDTYQKALSTLRENGYISEDDLQKLLNEKVSLNGDMDTIKTKINGLKKEIRQCEKIQVSLIKMKDSIEPKQERTLERTGDSIDRH